MGPGNFPLAWQCGAVVGLQSLAKAGNTPLQCGTGVGLGEYFIAMVVWCSVGAWEFFIAMGTTVQQSTGLGNILLTWQFGDVKCSAEWDKKFSEGMLCTGVHCTST